MHAVLIFSTFLLLSRITEDFYRNVMSCPLLNNCTCEVVALTETWLTIEIADTELLLSHPDFSFYRFDRPDRRDGGVLGIKNSISS